MPDSGRLIPTAPPPKYPPETRTFLSIPLASVHQLVDGLTRDGFNARWINVYKLPPSTVDFYDLIVCNSTANPTRGFLDLTGEQLSQEIVRQTAAGFSLWTISGRVRVNDTTPLYSVVFGRNPDFIETTALWGMHFLTHISKNSDLLNAGWSIISHTIFSSGAHLSISSVYQRDRRVARNISIPAEDRLPLRQNFYGIDFPQFSQLTLFYNTLRYYPRYVSIYYFGSPRNSQFSVIFEKKQNSTVNFFRWGRNITETTADIELFREHWDPVVVAGYRYKQHTDYFTEWRRRKRR